MPYYKAKYGCLNIIIKADNQSDALTIAMHKFDFDRGAISISLATDKEIELVAGGEKRETKTTWIQA